MKQRIDRSTTAILKTLILAAFIAAIPSLLFVGSTVGQAAQEASTKSQSSPAGSASRERFDFLVRADFFAGFAGDQAALERGMKVCEAALAKNPNHAEALVWRGGGLVFIAGQSFQKGDFGKGVELWDRGLKEMDRAVELEPGNECDSIPASCFFGRR